MSRPATKESFVNNLRHLMRIKEMSQAELARQSGVSQKTISNILNPEVEQSPSIETAEKLAKPFGLEGWHLIMPNLPEDLLTSPSLEKLLNSYISSSVAGREMIDRVAQREAEYTSELKK